MSIPHHSTHLAALDKLLARGASRTDAATALGITPSAVTQLKQAHPTPEQEAQLARSSALDEKYDEIEDMLLTQLKRTVPALLRPGEIARTLQIINSAKRRGVAASAETAPTHILSLNLPVAIQNRFVLNSSNQVVSAGAQDLVTIPSASVPKLLEAKHDKKLSIPPTGNAIEEEFGVDLHPTKTDQSR